LPIYSLFQKSARYDQNENQREETFRKLFGWTRYFFLQGGLFIVIYTVGYAWQFSKWPEIPSILGVAFMFSCAIGVSGGFLGFLFGIPYSRQIGSDGQFSQTAPKDQVILEQGVTYQVNTNLEQISDWLTKILIGASLTQISTLHRVINNLANFIAGGLGDNPAGHTLAMGLLIYFFVVGLLSGFLFTRLYLALSLVRAGLGDKFRAKGGESRKST
jgi:hypothetical protein